MGVWEPFLKINRFNQTLQTHTEGALELDQFHSGHLYHTCFFALWPACTMQMWGCLHLCNIKKNKFTYSHYLFVTEAPWYYACRREVSILGRGPFPCHPGQKTLPYIELSNGGVDPNVWQGGTRHKSGASDIELLFCQSWNSKIRNILCNIMHENFFSFSQFP